MKSRSAIILALVGVGLGAGAGWWFIQKTPAAPPPRPAAGETLDPQVASAVDAALAAIDAAPRDPTRRAELAMIYQANSLFVLAEPAWRQAIEAGGANSRWLYHLARVQAALGRTNEALATLDRIAPADAGYGPIHWRRGDWLLERGDLDSSRAAYQRAIDVAPQDPAGHVGLARVELMSNQPTEAARRLEPLVRQLPQVGYLHQLLGTAYRQLGRADDADRALAQASGQRPRWNDPWAGEVSERRTGYLATFEQSDRLVDAGRRAEALAMLQALREMYPDDGVVLAKIGEVYMEENDLRRAQTLFEQAIARDPGLYYAYIHLATVAQRRNDLRDAIDWLQQVIALHPTLGITHRRLGELHALRQEWPEAEAAYRQAVDCGVTGSNTRIDLAVAQYRQGRADEAIATLRALLAQRPNEPRGVVLLGTLLAEQGETNEARVMLERARRLPTNDPGVTEALRQLQALVGGGS